MHGAHEKRKILPEVVAFVAHDRVFCAVRDVIRSIAATHAPAVTVREQWSKRATRGGWRIYCLQRLRYEVDVIEGEIIARCLPRAPHQAYQMSCHSIPLLQLIITDLIESDD